MILPSSIWHPLGPPRPPWCAPGRRSSPAGHPCSLVQCPRLTCGGYALLFVLPGSLRIDLFQHAQIRGRGRRGPAAGPDCWPARAAGALCRAYGCHPPTLPARAPSGWSQPGRGGAPTVACVGLFWGAEAVARGGGRSVTFIRVPRAGDGRGALRRERGNEEPAGRRQRSWARWMRLVHAVVVLGHVTLRST
jgi:hypothetical protein